MKYVCGLALLLLSTTSLFSQQKLQFEDMLAGITVGKSTVADVRHLYGDKIIKTDDVGSFTARWDGQCEIYFAFYGPEHIEGREVIHDIILSRIGHGPALQSPCREFST